MLISALKSISWLISSRYHVPEHLASHIDYITPGIKLTPVVKRTVKNKRGSPWAAKSPLHVKVDDATPVPSSLANCSTQMTPACIKALYSIPDATLATPGNSLGLYQQGSYFAESDVNEFFATYATYIPQGTFPINASIDGGSYSVPASSAVNSGEANIDIEMT
jgi:tripeptidyl-peptidase I